MLFRSSVTKTSHDVDHAPARTSRRHYRRTLERYSFASLLFSCLACLCISLADTHFLKIAFSAIKRATLIRRLWAANSLDLILDFVLTYISVVFNYLGPFFLKRILDSLENIEDEDADDRARRISLAYIYAFLAFLSTCCKAEADVLHLWYGRRAATRMRSSLMTSIYDKALKRKDFSGIIDKDAEIGRAHV